MLCTKSQEDFLQKVQYTKCIENHDTSQKGIIVNILFWEFIFEKIEFGIFISHIIRG